MLWTRSEESVYISKIFISSEIISHSHSNHKASHHTFIDNDRYSQTLRIFSMNSLHSSSLLSSFLLTASTASTNSLPLIHLSTREIQEKWDEWAKKKEANKTSDVACIFCLTHVSSSQWDASCDINILTLDNCNGVCRSTRESQFDSIFCVIYKTMETLVLTLEVYEYKIFICFLRMDGSIQRFVRCSFSSSGDLLTRLLCSHLSQFRSGTSATTTWISSPLRREGKIQDRK